VAAALSNLEIVLGENLAERAARVGAVLQRRMAEIMKRFPSRIGAHHGKGLVAALHMVKGSSLEPDSDLAWNAIRCAVESGLLFFSPVGFGGANIKICPPLTITEEAVLEGAEVLEESIGKCIGR
jgi:4-aminobutyrate aminotransferase-like enzyme